MILKFFSLSKLLQRIHNPFHIACKLGDLKIVSFFTKHGAQLQVGNGDGLVCACEEGHRDVISYLLENMKEVFFLLFVNNFSVFNTIFTIHPHPFFFLFLISNTLQELNVGPLCFASREGEFDLAQFLISKNCPINGVHNLFVFSFFSFSFSKTLQALFSLSFQKSHITTVKSVTSDSCMSKQQFGYCRIIITKWSTSHCSSLLVFLITFFNTILSLLSFFFSFNLPSIWFWKNRERVFFIKFVFLVLLLYQLLRS